MLLQELHSQEMKSVKSVDYFYKLFLKINKDLKADGEDDNVYPMTDVGTYTDQIYNELENDSEAILMEIAKKLAKDLAAHVKANKLPSV